MRAGIPVALILYLAAAAAARAEDWRQFRGNEHRTGASADPSPVPLTDLWTAPGGLAPAVWRGRVFFVTQDKNGRALICADERTGAARWRRPLEGMLPHHRPIAPAISEEGVVFVYEWRHGTFSWTVPIPGGVRAGMVTDLLWISAYDAQSGRAVDTCRLPWVMPPRSPHLLLSEGQPSRQIELEPRPGASEFTVWQHLGEPLILENELLSAGFHLFRWSPGRPGQLTGIWHAFPWTPDGTGRLPADILEFPLAAAPRGVVTTALVHRTVAALPEKLILTLLAGDASAAWHSDLPWLPLGPIATADWIFGKVEGPDGNGIVAVEPKKGYTQWLYPPTGVTPPTHTLVQNGVTIQKRGGAPPQIRPLVGAWVDNPIGTGRQQEQLVLAQGRVYAEVNGAVVALDQKSGTPAWRAPLAPGSLVRCMTASRDHLFISLRLPESDKKAPRRLLALRLDTGKQEWSQEVPETGSLVLSDGLLYLADGSLHTFAPAERTYRMAVDSARSEDYRKEPAKPADAAPGAAGGAGPEGLKQGAVADASLLRIEWGRPVSELLAALRARRAAAPGVPLVLSLEWLDSSRSRVLGAPAAAPAELPDRAAFGRVCEALAAEARPAYFDLAPEVDVFLARHPEKLEAVRSLLREAAEAVHRAAPMTRVLLSFNAEVFQGTYGPGSFLPFGKVPVLSPAQRDEAASLSEIGDAVGVTSYPQAAYSEPAKVSGDMLIPFKTLAAGKPLLVTRLAVRLDPQSRNGVVEQAAFLKHLVQACYWLNAAVVAYPDLEAPAAETALRAAGERLALAVWRDTLGWKQVERLSAPAASRQ